MRGPLAQPPVPIAGSRREFFDDLVLDAAENISAFLQDERGTSLDAVDFVVEDMPVFEVGEEPDEVPFGRVEAGTIQTPPTVVIYRRTIELRSEDGPERAELVHDAVVEQVAELLGLDPDDIDPGFDG